MSLIKVLYISAFIFFNPVVEADSVSPEQCDKLVLKSSITLIDGQGAKVEIEAKGGHEPYAYIFYKKSGHLLHESFQLNFVEKLEKGKYYCTVTDKKGCYNTIEFEIK